MSPTVPPISTMTTSAPEVAPTLRMQRFISSYNKNLFVSKSRKSRIVYNKDGSVHNNPSGLTRNGGVDSGINYILRNYMPLFQVGIRALPGTKVYFNNNSNPVIIGFNGVFELDLSNSSGGVITSLSIDQNSLKEIEENDSAYLIIDMVYADQGDSDI